MSNAISKPYKRGSEWRKWDLHVHTPASYDWDKSCNATIEDIVDKALAEKISVIAITDHHTIEGIDEAVKAAKGKNLTILPGVELRTDKGNKGIHIIGVFDSTVTSKTIYDKLLCPLNLSKDDVNEKGSDQIYCNFEEACQKIHELGGLVLLHAGKKSNSIEQLDSDVRAALKKDLAFLVDIFEVSNQKQVDDYRKIVFPRIKQAFPCIITSDACDRSKLRYKKGHSVEVIGKKYSWIKADSTFAFEGLKQIIYEPSARVCLKDDAPLYSHPQIVSAKLLNTSGYQSKKGDFPPITLTQEIFFSPNLTTIIGPRAAGKTVLVELIGYVANQFSTDKKDKKLPLIEFLSKEFSDLEVEITFQNGAGEPIKWKRSVNDWNNPFYTLPFKIEYWAQGDIEKKANSSEQIADYINDRLHSDLLIKAKKEIEELRKEMESLRSSYSGKLQTEIEKNKLEAERKQIEAYFEKLKTEEYKQITDKIKNNREKRQLIEVLAQDIKNQIAALKDLTRKFRFSSTINKDKLLELFSAHDPLRKKIEEFYQLNETQLNVIVDDLEKTAKAIENSNIKKELDNENIELTRQFANYCKSNGITITKEEVEKRNNRIKFINQQISNLESQLRKYEGDKNRHEQLAAELSTKLKLWKKENDKLIKNFNKDLKNTEISIFWNNPASEVAKWIKSQFIESNSKLKGMIETAFKIKSSIRENYIEDIIDELVKNYGTKSRKKIASTLKQNKTPALQDSSGKIETIRWFFEDPNTKPIREDIIMRLSEYAETGYNCIKYKDKVLGRDSMSFGERCGALVEFILSFGDHPLIIDQPEDHLDAKFVAERVVDLIRKQKVNRQVIICTHNANVVVLGDSELVTTLSVKKKGNVSVEQGSLENIQMRKTIFDILEGGETAFKKREQKYGKAIS